MQGQDVFFIVFERHFESDSGLSVRTKHQLLFLKACQNQAIFMCFLNYVWILKSLYLEGSDVSLTLFRGTARRHLYHYLSPDCDCAGIPCNKLPSHPKSHYLIFVILCICSILLEENKKQRNVCSHFLIAKMSQWANSWENMAGLQHRGVLFPLFEAIFSSQQ